MPTDRMNLEQTLRKKLRKMAKESLGDDITELRLGLPGDNGRKLPSEITITKEIKKRAFLEISEEDENGVVEEAGENDRKMSPAAKTQAVGWPPVCSYRRKNGGRKEASAKTIYVKVSMDCVPFLRKIDLGKHKGYGDLAEGLEGLFGCLGICRELKDAESSEFVPIYEDKDGDWMLAGDVPWQMFIESCKRLRVMKRSDANGFGLQKGIVTDM